MVQNEGRLYPRGYEERSVLNHLSRVLEIKRENPLSKSTKKKPNKRDSRVMFITTYNPNMHSRMSIISKHWHILQTNSQCAAVFKDKPQVVYWKCKNLQDLLVRAQVKNTQPMAEETQKIIVPLYGTQPTKVNPFDYKCRDFPCKELKISRIRIVQPL